MKKWLSMFLTAGLLFGMLSLQVLAADADNAGFVPQSEAWGNDYTTATEFTISNEADLRTFADLVNEGKDFSGKTVSLGDDVTLSSGDWKTIGGKGSTSFAGTFNGNNHTISGLSLTLTKEKIQSLGVNCAGLFGTVTGTVQNVVLDSINITSMGTTGGIAAKLDDNAVVQNCSVSGSITMTPINGTGPYSVAGGIVGQADTNTAEVISCHNSASIVSGGSNGTGGIVGNAKTSIKISDCSNSGNISGKANVGGVAGSLSGGNVKTCTNSGTISGSDEQIGGIVGKATTATITDSINTGSVTATSGTKVGGIVGYTYAGTSIEDCTNSGVISGQSDIGGITGLASPDSGSTLNLGYVITGCSNIGSVSGTSNIAGIVGTTNAVMGSGTSTVKVTDCLNKATVTGSTNIGGIVGANNAVSTTATQAINIATEVSGNINVGSVPQGSGAIVGNNNATGASNTTEKPGIVENNFWPENLGSSAVGSGAGSSDTETAETVKNNSSYKADGTLNNPISTGSSEDSKQISNLGEALKEITGSNDGSTNVPDALKVTVTYNKNGHGDTETVSVPMGTKITLEKLPNVGYYTFLNWTVNGEAVGETYSVMADTTFTANWRNDKPSSSSTPSYAVTTPSQTENGTVSVTPKSAKKGATVTLTVTPDEGYQLEALTVTDAKGNVLALTDRGDGKFTFTMPASKVAIEATFVETEAPVIPPTFTDVPADAYYADAVKWAVDQGITTGATSTTFEPNASCTRAQVVTFLWRAAGSPKATGADPFTDLDPSAYYHEAVLWAVEQGVTLGTSPTTFSPDQVVSRAQVVTFLHRYEDTPAGGGDSPFTDVTGGSYYADAVQWAVDQGITTGTTPTTFSPEDDCTRGQIVTFLYRALAQ